MPRAITLAFLALLCSCANTLNLSPTVITHKEPPAPLRLTGPKITVISTTSTSTTVFSVEMEIERFSASIGELFRDDEMLPIQRKPACIARIATLLAYGVLKYGALNDADKRLVDLLSGIILRRNKEQEKSTKIALVEQR